MKKVNYPIYAALCSLLLISGSCSTEKSTSISRFYQGLTTRYNVYYNGNQNYIKASQNQLQNTIDDYTLLLPLHPVSSLNGRLNNEFDRTIEKCQKAIKTHSIKIKPDFNGYRNTEKYKQWQLTEEYNPFLHNAWLLMAKAQFYKGDFEASSSTFSYIIRHFRNLPNVVREAQIWNARCSAELKDLYEAEDILGKIKKEELTSGLKYEFNVAQADLLLKQKLYPHAADAIQEVLKAENNKTQKWRLNFLLGQIRQSTGNSQAAYHAFSNVIRLSPPYDAQFAARIRLTECAASENSTHMLRTLTSMTKKAKNKEYLDQLFYAIGNIYLSKKDTSNAVHNYVLSVEKNKKNASQKAMAQLKLGDIYFEKRMYAPAQPSYAGAIASLPKDFDGIELVKKRSDALDELIVHYQNVHLQDSLLTLASMNEADRLMAIKRVIAEIDRKEKEEKEKLEKEKQEDLALQRKAQMEAEFGTPNTIKTSTFTPTTSSDNSWYFYNTQSVSKGKTEFQSRWGSRKLEDNWRRRNKSDYVFADQEKGETKSTEQIGETIKPDSITANPKEKSNDPKDPKYYLSQIPSTPEEIKNANDIVSEGLFNMAYVYQTRLEDYPLSVSTYNTLLKRYPDTKNKIEAYFNLYQIARTQNDVKQADYYKDKIISEFPQSRYAAILSNPNYLAALNQKSHVIDSLYAQAYSAYLKNDLTFVRSSYERVQKEAPMSVLMPKFMMLNALTFISEKKNDEFKKQLKELLDRYPNADVSSLAGAMMSNAVQGRVVTGEKISTDIWSKQIKASESEAMASTDKNTQFTVDPISPHLMLFVFPADSTYNNKLIYEVAGFNFANFAVRDFDIDMLPLQGIGLLRVKGFNTFDEAFIYRQRLFGPKGISNRLPSQLKTVLISEKNFDSLLMGRTFDEYFKFYEKNFGGKK